MYFTLIKLFIRWIPLDQMVAWALNYLIKQLVKISQDPNNSSRFDVLIARIARSISVAYSVLEDGVITADEVTDAKIKLLEIWSKGGQHPELEAKVAKLTAKKD